MILVYSHKRHNKINDHDDNVETGLGVVAIFFFCFFIRLVVHSVVCVCVGAIRFIVCVSGTWTILQHHNARIELKSLHLCTHTYTHKQYILSRTGDFMCVCRSKWTRPFWLCSLIWIQKACETWQKPSARHRRYCCLLFALLMLIVRHPMNDLIFIYCHWHVAAITPVLLRLNRRMLCACDLNDVRCR